ncbi:hypothetical protein O7632_01860 [Solwaraspora sp. WMMD406]|uniref:hypothetical protein n=1 Tax=Solwaraspora sp. WMMD406 TaxID=3016095 RepID=UPI002416B0AC|nr:hypothetical protein [Solwaraspora sp. WMMD406]MDG4762866.1 hypothetical protein [Solwaraspora sp. WMMD406]
MYADPVRLPSGDLVGSGGNQLSTGAGHGRKQCLGLTQCLVEHLRGAAGLLDVEDDLRPVRR